ncbi:MAG: hypothetical protein J3Q66DRAFT_418816 [Benniella sp.]|nr:MAG: hypothetical protein J3Q66DRAFT_418816 [Benniella sp.]
MLFGSILSSPLDSLLPQQALQLANVYLDNANKATDPFVALVLCHDTEVSLSQAKKSFKRLKIPDVRQGIATAYDKLSELLDSHRLHDEAEAFRKKALTVGERTQDQKREHSKAPHRDDDQEGRQGRAQEPKHRDDLQEGLQEHVQEIIQEVQHESDHYSEDQAMQKLDSNADNQPVQVPLDPMSIPNDVKPPQVHAAGQKQGRDMAKVPQAIFSRNVRPPALEIKLPKADERLNTTPQLAACLGLLKNSQLLEDMLDPVSRKWLQAINKDTDEQERLKALVTNVIRAFQREEIKNDKAVAEVLCLAPVLDKSDFQHLLRELCKGFDQSILLDEHQLDGIAQLIRYAEPGYLDADDLVKILQLLHTRLRTTHTQSSHHMYQLTVSVSRVLDAMADANVEGLNREELHEPLCVYLSEIKGDISDPYLAYQVSYAYQALLYVPDDETPLQATMRRTCKVIQGVTGLVSAVKGVDFNGFMDGLKDIQHGISGAAGVFNLAKSTFGVTTSLVDGGKDFVECMKVGLGFKRKQKWYSTLRGAEALLRSGQLANFRRLVCEAPCQLDPAFQWGVIQLLSEIATDPIWDAKTRRGAVMFLGEMYNNRAVWKNQADIQERILVILIKLASFSGNDVQANEMIREIEAKADFQERARIQACRQKDHTLYPLRIASSAIASPSLIDRAQDRPDVEGHIRQLRKQRLMEQGTAVYIPPQAKAGLQASDESRFQLMEKVKEFLNSEQKVFLLLGEPGAGKSTFSRALDRDLWDTYPIY